ncbi:hypothetical protein EDD11_004878 [Mortierella claussenii]|nr:hypothetical protein EDD11_004878 [Mortierella claussenii]
MMRAPKKYRQPVSIFDLPCPPASAPPQDNKSFFAHLDSVERTLEEEDAGQIPKALETGPQIIVESLNKKRRRIPGLSSVATSATEPPVLPVIEAVKEEPAEELKKPFTTMESSFQAKPHSQSSLSAASLASIIDSSSISSHSSSSLSFTTDTTPATDDTTDSIPAEKKVRFSQDPAEIRVIERRKKRVSRHRERSSTPQSSLLELPPDPLAINTAFVPTSPPTETSISAPLPPRGRILTPDMPSFEDQQFQNWLSGNSPPPPLPVPVVQQISDSVAESSHTPTTRKRQVSERLREALANRLKEPLSSVMEVTSLSAMETNTIDQIEQLPAEQSHEHDQSAQVTVVEMRNDNGTGIGVDDTLAVSCKDGASGTHQSDITSELSMADTDNKSSNNNGGNKASGISLTSTVELLEDAPVADNTPALVSVQYENATSSAGIHSASNTHTHASSSTATVDSDLTAVAAFPRSKLKKTKDTVTSIASVIGSRRKHTIPTRPPNTEELSTEAVSGSTRSRSTGAAEAHPPARSDVLVIESDDDDDDPKTKIDARIASQRTRPAPSRPTEIINPTSTALSAKQKSQIPKVNKETKSSEASATKATALSGLGLYVIPNNMVTGVFNITRKRVLELRGKWLGPKFKVLSTDPRAKADIPPLDQENTTHIVTALTSVEDVKRFLNVDKIDPKIAIVNRDWLSDTIMYKTPMEPQGYALRKIDTSISAPAVPSSEDTPPHSQPRTTAAAETSSSTTDIQRYAKFESTETGHQVDFTEIMQGIQEGSLNDDDVSGPEDDHVEPGEDAESEANVVAENMEPEESVEPKHVDENALKVSGLELPHGLTPELVQQLYKENRCFRCRQVGHWMNRCPQHKPGTSTDDVLLQIINSGKSEASIDTVGKRRRKILYQCESPHIAGKKDEPRYNKAILEQLKILMDHYDSTQTKDNKYHFKVINYRKAITAIRALDYEITSEEMARKVPRVGKKIAQKIGECVALGRIKKLDHLNWDHERSTVETLFRSVYGVGSEKATEWYNKGLRTLDDLRKLPDLTKNQISGLQYYEDLLKRIPRAEVEEIGKVVESTAKQLHPDIQSQVTGSYRRGQPDCGDIDIVVARPDVDRGDELFLIMEHILKVLINQGFLVDHLSLPVWSDDMEERPKHFKYMGICRLPGEDSVHHHIDILVVPWMHLGAVLLYFTGNDICNRSMRLLASNRGMRLSDKGLFAGVMRGKSRKRLNEGHWVAGRTEREIFDYLKINYLEPYEREC